MQKLTFLLLAFSFFVSDISAQFSVGTTSFSYLDPTRNNRDVYGEVYFPTDANGNIANGEFPIIVFGHGFVVQWDEYSVWWDQLVPQGYIMVFPRTEGNLSPNHGTFGEDLSFLVDTYLAENTNNASPFFEKLNGKAAVMGHSMGGGASFLAADGNTNVTTQVSLAAAETNPSAIAAAGNMTIPALVVASSRDCVAPPADHQLLMYNALASSFKTYIEITDGNHCNYGIASLGSNCVLGETFTFCSGFISQASQHQQMFDIVNPWMDYYLKMDPCAMTEFQNYTDTNDGTLHTKAQSGMPAAPMVMAGTATNVMDMSAMISWEASNYASSYTVEFRPVGTSMWLSQTTANNMIALTGLASGTNYEFSITVNCTQGGAYTSPLGNFTTTSLCLFSQTYTSHPIITEVYEVSDHIISTGIVLNGADITYHAGNYIDLLPGFEVVLNADFLGEMVPCVP